MAAGFAIATARNTTPPAGCALDPRRAISTSQHMFFCPTPASESVEASHARSELRPQNRLYALARYAPTDSPLCTRASEQLPDAAEPEYLVHLRRHSRLLPRRADRHRHRARDALYAGLGDGFRLRRAHHARCEFGMAAALSACQRRVDVFHRRLHSHFPRPLLRLDR